MNPLSTVFQDRLICWIELEFLKINLNNLGDSTFEKVRDVSTKLGFSREQIFPCFTLFSSSDARESDSRCAELDHGVLHKAKITGLIAGAFGNLG